MRPAKLFPLLLALIVLSLALTGCGLVSPALRLMTGARPTSTPRVIERVVVATPAPAATDRGAAPAQPQAPVQINIVPGADPETQIYEAIYRKVNPSVVYIANLARMPSSSSSETLPESEGSGFVWDTQGYIVTNNHVVANADALEVTFDDGLVLPAEVVGADPDSDLAVIRVDPALALLTPIEQGDINEVRVGQRAVAIGNPFGLVGSMTTGIVSAIGRSVRAATGYSIPLASQTDAASRPGNAGGPLLNERGQVIGINFQIRSDVRANSGVGFAIPINIVQRVVPALIENGVYKHAWLGVSGQTYSPAWAESLGFPAGQRGAYVITVVRNSPAQRAGVRGGSSDSDIVIGLDMQNRPVYLPGGGDLIIAIDDQPVKTFDDVLIYLESYKSPAETVTLKVLRPGKAEMQIPVTLGERPSQAP